MCLLSASSFAIDYGALLHPPEARQQLVTAPSEDAVAQSLVIAPERPAMPLPHSSRAVLPKLPGMISATSAIVLPVFVNQAVVASLSFDYLNRGAMQQMAMRYFTQQGWFKFMTLDREKQRRQVVAREAVVKAVALDAPQVTSTRPGQWVVTMPVLQSFRRHGKMMAHITYDVTVLLSPGHAPGSWLVSSMVLNPRKSASVAHQ